MSLPNPFQPPKSSVENSPVDAVAIASTDHPRKRPKLVWVISAVYVISVIAMNAYFLAHLLGYGSNSVYAAGLANLTVFDYAKRILGATLSLAAGISLFLLKKIAVLLFATSLIFGLVIMAYGVSVGTAQPRGLTGLLIPGLVFWYSLRLKKQGLLV